MKTSAVMCGLLLPISALAAHAQMAPLAECANQNSGPDARIAACTTAIAGGTLEKSVLVMAHVNRGRWLLEKGDSKGALADLTKAVDLDPANPNYALYYRGQAHLAAGSKAQAITDFTTILKTNPAEGATRDALKKLGVEPPALPAPSGGGGGGGGGGFIFF